MKENLKVALSMVKEKNFFRMVMFILDLTQMEGLKDKESISGMMELSMKDSLKMV